MVSPGLPGESVEPGGRRPDGGGICPDTLVKYYFSMETPSLMMFLVGAIVVFVFNLLLMIFLMLRNTRRVEKAMSPILQGIQALSRGSYRSLDECGELAEINAGLNQAGAYLMQKDNARAEWIRGVSHDIRTPPLNGAGLRQRAGGR